VSEWERLRGRERTRGRERERARESEWMREIEKPITNEKYNRIRFFPFLKKNEKSSENAALPLHLDIDRYLGTHGGPHSARMNPPPQKPHYILI